MKKIGGVLVVGIFSCLGTAIAADPASHPAPMQRAVESLEKNLVKNPDNPGLPKALDHISENIARKQSKDNPPASDAQFNQHVERPGPVDRVERPELPDRLELPERPHQIGRPDVPGRGKK